MPPSKSEYWVKLYFMKMSRNAAKAGASRGGASALSAQSLVESTLGMTQSSDSAFDQVMNSYQTLSNQVLGGVQSARNSPNIFNDASSPLAGSSGGRSAINSATNNMTQETLNDTFNNEGRGGGAADGDGAADGGGIYHGGSGGDWYII